MTLPIDTLLDPMTVDQCRATIYSVIAATGVDTTLWKPGAVTRTLITGAAIILAALSTMVALIGRSGFLEYATGSWLTLVALYVYGVDRILATFAAGSVIINNSGGGVYSYAIGDLQLVNPTTGKTYRNTAVVSVGALQTGVVVPIVADESGSGSSALLGEISAFATPPLGLSVSNPAAVLGTDDEEDPPLRQRCRDKLGALSPNGPPDAYGYVARNAKRSDGSPIGITRVRIEKDGYGNIFAYLASPSGVVPPADVAAVDLLLQQQATPLGVTLYTSSATAAIITTSANIWLYNESALTTDQLTATINTALVAYLKTTPIGGNIIGVGPGKIYHDVLAGVIARATPASGADLGIFRVDIPPGDITLSTFDVPILGTTTWAFTQIPVPSQ